MVKDTAAPSQLHVARSCCLDMQSDNEINRQRLDFDRPHGAIRVGFHVERCMAGVGGRTLWFFRNGVRSIVGRARTTKGVARQNGLLNPIFCGFFAQLERSRETFQSGIVRLETQKNLPISRSFALNDGSLQACSINSDLHAVSDMRAIYGGMVHA